MNKPEIKIGVRNLIEFIYRSGDINMGGFTSNQPLLEGTRVHRKLQKEAGEGYRSEVRLSCEREFDDFSLAVNGIADGIITSQDGVMIDEIKMVSLPLEEMEEENFLHWAQAKCYGYMAALQMGLETIQIRLTYYQEETEKTKYMIREFTFAELKAFFDDMVDRYYPWMELSVNHKKQRDQSIQALPFPFESYRKGQREFAAAVYRATRDKKTLFAQAPTGTGKTISSLFPAMKAMGEGMGEKIFYLTAKTVARQVAENAVLHMADKGLVVKSITLTAKDKICPCEVRSCTPEDCPRAKGHFDRVNDAIMDIVKNEILIDRDTLEKYAEKHNVCPFEYSLDIALWTDCVICDYNYVFDPRAYLRRFFELGGDYILLVDEAHNLVDRAREMFSASLSKRSFMEYKKEMKGKAPAVYKAMVKINQYFIELRKSLGEEPRESVIDFPADLSPHVETFIEELESFLGSPKNTDLDPGLLELFFDCLTFHAVCQLYDERYVSYVVEENRDMKIRLFCLDPSYLLQKASSRGRAAVFFSATLLPLPYFKDMLGGSEDSGIIRLPSPFAPDNLCLMAAGNISTRYKDREASCRLVAEYIKASTKQKTGNYLVFFPSFAYMNKVYSFYKEAWPHDQTVVQENGMDEAAREEFLRTFRENPEHTLIAFAVMGGIFSEGIDLTGDRLSGAIIVGVGLPQLCMERNVIRNYFNRKNGFGYEYAYMYPGMNRVMQAAGRVIRTEEDRGFVLLLDGRFLQRNYLGLFPQEWSGYQRVWNPEMAGRNVESFWKHNK